VPQSQPVAPVRFPAYLPGAGEPCSWSPLSLPTSLMDRNTLWVLGAGATVVLLTAWVLYPRPPRPTGAGGRYRYMHCWDCKRESAYSEREIEKGCPHCGGQLVPTMESLADRGGFESPVSKLLGPILAEVTILLAAVLYLNRSSPATSQDDRVYLRTRCTNCRRKLRYPPERGGQTGRCPGCKQSLVFPPEAPEED
jgi:ribosomal protein S27E